MLGRASLSRVVCWVGFQFKSHRCGHVDEQTAPSRRKRESTTATASMSGPAAEKGRRSIKPEPAATKEALPSKRAKLEAVPEEEESMQPVEHPSRLKVGLRL